MYRLPPAFADMSSSPAALFWKELYQLGRRQYNSVEFGDQPIVIPDIREEVRLMEYIDLTGMNVETFLEEFQSTGGGRVKQDGEFAYTIRLSYGTAPARGLVREHGFAGGGVCPQSTLR